MDYVILGSVLTYVNPGFVLGVSKDVFELRTSTGSDATILKNLTSLVYRQLILFFFSFAVYTRERRLPRMSQKAFNRWHLTVTLLRNPCLIKYRKRVGISRATSVSLRSIRTDLSELAPLLDSK